MNPVMNLHILEKAEIVYSLSFSSLYMSLFPIIFQRVEVELVHPECSV
jgi:hypothetical protein